MDKNKETKKTNNNARLVELGKSVAETAREHVANATYYAVLGGLILSKLHADNEVSAQRNAKLIPGAVHRKIPSLPHDAGTKESEGYPSENWPSICAKEMGISDDTARRWMALADKVCEAIGYDKSEAMYGVTMFKDFDEMETAIDENSEPFLRNIMKLCHERSQKALLTADFLSLADAADAAKSVGPDASAGEEDTVEHRVGSPEWYKGLDSLLYQLRNSKLEEGDEARIAYIEQVAMADDTPESLRETAYSLLARCASGRMKLARAYTGLKGESDRIMRGKAGGKAATNHAKNFEAGIIKLGTSAEHFYDLQPKYQTRLIAKWTEHAMKLPEPFIVALVKAYKSGTQGAPARN